MGWNHQPAISNECYEGKSDLKQYSKHCQLIHWPHHQSRMLISFLTGLPVYPKVVGFQDIVTWHGGVIIIDEHTQPTWSLGNVYPSFSSLVPNLAGSFAISSGISFNQKHASVPLSIDRRCNYKYFRAALNLQVSTTWNNKLRKPTENWQYGASSQCWSKLVLFQLCNHPTFGRRTWG